MPDRSIILPAPTPDQRRAAAGQFERANQVISTGDYDYGIQLLLSCCKLDPANLIYRQLLRRTEKTKYKNNLRGSRLAWLFIWPLKARIKAAQRARDHIKVLEHGELILTRNPWDLGAQKDMARAAEELDLDEVAVWILEQARNKNPREPGVNRQLALAYEKTGNFTQAITVWDAMRRTNPDDQEARRKLKELSARDAIARGQYEETVAHETILNSDDTEERDGEPADGEAEAPPQPGNRRLLTLDPVVLQLRQRIQADPTNWQYYLQLAASHRRNGQLEQARQVLQQGLGPTSNRFELVMELAELEIEPFRRNLTITEEKLKANPADEELKKIRVRLLKEINTRELELFRQRADRQPAEMGHRYELGLRLLRANQIDEAIKELQLARDDMRYKWRALLYLGHCFKGRNNWRLALRNFDEAMENLPSNETNARKDILYHLAVGAAETGNLPVAVERGMELANLDFGYRNISRLLDDWQAGLQKANPSK